MATRVVMVRFRDGVDASDVAAFRGWLEDLAARTPHLRRMHCGAHAGVPADERLSQNAPDVTFADFASVWEFDDLEGVGAFLEAPFHRELAGSGFRDMVRRRYVINIDAPAAPGDE